MGITLLQMAALGLTAGLASGLFGVGGGIVIVPLLIWIFGFSILQANAISLVALLLPVGGLAVYEYYQSGFINQETFKYGLIIAFGLFLGAFGGAKIAQSVDVILLKKGFALLLVFAAIRLWFFSGK